MTAAETFQNNGDCRMMPPVSTSNALAMGPREDRIFRRSSSRYGAGGGLDAQGIYPSSAVRLHREVKLLFSWPTREQVRRLNPTAFPSQR